MDAVQILSLPRHTCLPACLPAKTKFLLASRLQTQRQKKLSAIEWGAKAPEKQSQQSLGLTSVLVRVPKQRL